MHTAYLKMHVVEVRNDCQKGTIKDTHTHQRQTGEDPERSCTQTALGPGPSQTQSPGCRLGAGQTARDCERNEGEGERTCSLKKKKKKKKVWPKDPLY